MMRTLVAFLVLLGSVILGIQLSHDPGYVLITINHWIIESTLWFTLLCIVLASLSIYFLLKVTSKIIYLPLTIQQWNKRRLIKKAQFVTQQGLIEYTEGYWKKANNHLIEAIPNTDTPLLNYLTAARAAQKMGNTQLRDQYLKEAQQNIPEAKIAVELTQAQLQLSENQWDKALVTLRRLYDLAPRHPYVLKLLINLYREVQDWPQLIALLPSVQKNQVLPEQEFVRLKEEAYLQALRDLIRQKQDHQASVFFKSLPKSLAHNAALIAEYSGLLLQKQEYNKAISLIKHSLKKDFNDQLIEFYVILPAHSQQLEFAESLLDKNPHSATLFLCLGRLCMTEHLWGKAKHYLQQSNTLHPNPVTYAELGTLYEKLNDPLMACESYKKGLELAIQSEV